MKTFKIFFIIVLFMLSPIFVSANNEQPKGIYLGEYAFGIPVDQLNFNNQSPFTFSFWLNIKEFNHSEFGTQFINVRSPNGDWISCDWGWLVSSIVATGYDDWENVIGRDMLNASVLETTMSTRTAFKTLKIFQFQPGEWIHASFTYKFTYRPEVAFYINGEQICEYVAKNYTTLLAWNDEYIIMVGGPAFRRSPLNAHIDKMQFYNKALSQAEIIESMTAPLLNDASLLGYWDFEDGSTTDTNGFMQADNGTIKATMYRILSNGLGHSIGTEVKPFTFGDGVDPESVIQGVEESVAEAPKTKAYVSAGVLYIENAEGITSVEVYNSLGTPLYRRGAGGEDTSLQIALPSTIKGLLIVKVNNEVIKVICN